MTQPLEPRITIARTPNGPASVLIPVDEYERLAAVVEAARAVRELWRHDAMAAAAPAIHTFVAAVDALDAPEATDAG